jgi:GNAT superfamily N-acetyltransferase
MSRQDHPPSLTSATSAVGDPDDWLTRSARNLAGYWDHTARALGQRAQRWEAAWAADAGSPSPFLNSATLLLPLTDEHAGEIATRLAEFYTAGQGGPWMLWSAWPTPDLHPHGLSLVDHPPLMVRPVGAIAAPPPELRIVEVRDESALADFNATFIDGYPVTDMQAAGMTQLYDRRVLDTPLHLWAGYVGGEPVTVAAAYVDEHAVGIYAVATRSHARGKGYGGAITAHATQVAPALPAVLQASDDGLTVYQRLGFESIARYSLWMGRRAE